MPHDMTDDEFKAWLPSARAEARHINSVFGHFKAYAASLPDRLWVQSENGLWKSTPR